MHKTLIILLRLLRIPGSTIAVNKLRAVFNDGNSDKRRQRSVSLF
jgi:hypothetical protein